LAPAIKEADLDVRFITPAGVELSEVADLPELLTRTDGLVWVDVAQWNEEAEEVLTSAFGFHELAIEDSARRNHVPKVHLYDDHLFLVLFAPHQGERGHVHYVELDLFVSDHYLVTVHGPLNPAVEQSAAMIEVDSVMKRVAKGKLKPANAYELSYAVIKSMAARMRRYTTELTKEVWRLEQQVSANELGNPDTFLDEMFWTRHGLLTVSTLAALTRVVGGRMLTVGAWGRGHEESLLEDIVDRFDRLSIMADTQKAYLQGTIEFYQARTSTKMTLAAERLAMIAAITAPATAVSSILGMNLIVNDHTQWGAIIISLAVMFSLSTMLILWAKRRGWF
jgi:magnesium transporter